MSDFYKKYGLLTLDDLNAELRNASRENNIEAVKYLLTSSELRENAEIASNNNGALVSACSNGNLEVIKYLLTSPELKENANIYANGSYAVARAYSTKNIDVFKYLILEYQIDKNEYIELFLEQAKNSPFTDEVNKLFSIKDLKKSLEDNLPLRENKIHKKTKL